MIGLQAFMALCQQLFPELANILSHIGLFGHGHGHSHSHGAEELGPNINAAWLAGGSIIIKEWLYRATMKVAKEKRSSVLASNAYHHRVDSLTAFVALLTITASHFFTQAQWLDPVGGLVISGMIVQAGFGNTKAALLELADVAMDPELRGNIEQIATKAIADAQDVKVKGVQGVKSGQNFMIEIEVAAPKTWTLVQTDELETKIREQVGAQVKGVKRVSVRFTDAASEKSAFAAEFVNARENEVESAEQDLDHSHDDHDHNQGHDHEDKQLNGQSNGTARLRK